MISKFNGYKVVNKGNSRANSGAATAAFEGSIVRTTRDMPGGGNQFGGTEKERVLQEQIRQEFQTASLEIRSSLNQRR